MSVFIETSYGKTIGLPNYSSHKFCLAVKTEVADLGQVAAEAQRVYTILQTAVDAQMAQPGYVPNGHGGNGTPTHTGTPSQPAPNGHGTATSAPASGAHAAESPNLPWNCSPKQRQLIEDLVAQNNLEFAVIGDLARQRFGKELAKLNRLEASGLIDELLEAHGERRGASGRRYARQPAAAGRRGA